MPKAVFQKMWETISGGQAWNGLIKNLRKDGLYYWVDAEILPIVDNEKNITGYIAVRKPSSRKNIDETQEIYKKMLELESKEQ
jgi:aerotaxis receptor